MNLLAQAEDFDRRDKLLEASQIYEEAIAKGEPVMLRHYIQLAVLYFVCADYGYSSEKRHPQHFFDAAFANAKKWLNIAFERCGESNELRFWNSYVDFVILGDPPFDEECKKLLEQGESLVPVFYLYASTHDDVYQQKAEELYHSVMGGRTAKERYIKSVLEPLVKI